MKIKILFSIIAAIIAFAIGKFVFFDLPVSTDESSYIFQAHTFKELKLSHPYPDMALTLKAPHDMQIFDKKIGWVSRYSPGHALWLLPGAIFNNPHIMKIIACALSIYVMCSIASLLNIPVLMVFSLLIISPFYLFMYGTLFSHISSFLFVSLMLWSYIKLRQTNLIKYAFISGLCWGGLFLIRTYTATLIAIPYAFNAATHFLQKRNKELLFRYVIFASSAFTGVILYKLYNYFVTGDSSIPTYLYYEASENLGFGMRHLNGLPVMHTFQKGMSNMMQNILSLDQWLFGIGGMLFVSFVLAIFGWSISWSPLLLSSVLVIWGGYVFFWFSGPRHIGPAYYFETLPFIILLLSLGINKMLIYLKEWKKIRIALCSVSLCAVVFCSITFIKEKKEFFNKELSTQKRIMKTLKSSPKQSLVILEDIVYPQFGRISINEKGLKSDPLVVQSRREYNYLIVDHFKDRTPFILKGGTEDKLIPFKVDEKKLHPLPKVKINASDMLHLTGKEKEICKDKNIRVKTAKKDQDEENFLAYGKYINLVPGIYIANYKFQKINCNPKKSSKIDISADNGQTIIAEKSLSGVHENKNINLEFEIKDFIRVEPRVYYSGMCDISLISIEINEKL